MKKRRVEKMGVVTADFERIGVEKKNFAKNREKRRSDFFEKKFIS